MRSEFFESVIMLEEGRPYLTCTVDDGHYERQVIAQISVDQDGALVATVTEASEGRFPFGELELGSPSSIRLRLPKRDHLLSQKDDSESIWVRGTPENSEWTTYPMRILLETDQIYLTQPPVAAGQLWLWYEGVWDPAWRLTGYVGGEAAEFAVECDEYRATVFVDPHDMTGEGDVELKVVRKDRARMSVEELNRVVSDWDHTLAFMRGYPTAAKVGIARFDDCVYRGTTPATWAFWRWNFPREGLGEWNWVPLEGTTFETIASEILARIDDRRKRIVQRYSHAAAAFHRGDWMSTVTATVAILEHLARERPGPSVGKRAVTKLIPQYLEEIGVERHFDSAGWKDEGDDLGPEEYPIQELVKLRNSVTAHWDPRAEIPENALWLTSQALYYVEACIKMELAPSVPQLDRTRGFHHFPSKKK